MVRIGVVGIGNIAQKAYLPILGKMEGVELHLVTRNEETLRKIGDQYRIKNRYRTVEEILTLPLDGVFVHTATESHPSIVSTLLHHGFHVYVDKPLAYTYQEAERLVRLAEKMNRILMVGFNRRFAPMVRDLKAMKGPKLLLMEKNRSSLPGEIRTFLFDDFIHVADTLRFLLQEPILNFHVHTRREGELLYHIALHLISKHHHAIGIMNRDNGVAEEKIEVMSPGWKREIRNLNEGTDYRDGKEIRLSFGDWDPILYRRGFTDIITHFIEAIQGKRTIDPSAQDALETHLLLEKVIEHITGEEMERRGV
ncbi:Gfo/Idh/MocA family protein [Thermicanus aegyptius]|uniref:Gfo/Idh/MocA family protein n=1 Tax=Thermicanus aegyptius TaxID=94009 RepID=UPI0003F592B2|nr:Gfo/Idh/MocA family oxidoreductase [Thermicanus aegyptius]